MLTKILETKVKVYSIFLSEGIQYDDISMYILQIIKLG